MELLDRLPGNDRRGVVVVIVLGIAALLAASLLVWQTRDDDDVAEKKRQPSAPASAPETAPETVLVVAKRGGFEVDAPAGLYGTSLQKGRAVRFSTPNRRLVITVGPSGRSGLKAGHGAEVAGVRAAYPAVKVDRQLRTTWGGRAALRSVGSLRREGGDTLVFSVTTTARGKQTWSAVMFADQRMRPAALARWYQPVLDGFRLLR